MGDVPVESSYHGSALLYRLLQDYPADRLRIVEGDFSSLPDRRLPAVVYEAARTVYPRLQRTRFHRWYSLWLSLTSVGRARKVPALLDGFQPQAVLTVAHGHLWATAAEFASRHQLPLHLIVHDDWPRVARLPKPFGARTDVQFGRVYRTAASRLCVSPFMVKEYRRRYGVDGEVLYPSRAKDTETFGAPPERLQDTSRGIVCAFAGTINSADYSRLLRALAECLRPYGGRVLIFGPLTAEQAARVGLIRPNIDLRGLLKRSELVDRLRDEVDVLFVPMSFLSTDRANMEVSFPSKLTDYTAIGLPLLIVGPAYCSAVRWAGENPGLAEVVDADDFTRLGAAIQRLVNDSEHRIRLAATALSIGDRLFSHTAAQSQFHDALRRSLVA